MGEGKWDESIEESYCLRRFRQSILGRFRQSSLELARGGSNQLGDRPQMVSQTGWETVATGCAFAVWLGYKPMETQRHRPVG